MYPLNIADDSGTSPTVVAELQGKILLLHSELEEQRKEMQTKDRQILALVRCTVKPL